MGTINSPVLPWFVSGNTVAYNCPSRICHCHRKKVLTETLVADPSAENLRRLLKNKEG